MHRQHPPKSPGQTQSPEIQLSDRTREQTSNQRPLRGNPLRVPQQFPDIGQLPYMPQSPVPQRKPPNTPPPDSLADISAIVSQSPTQSSSEWPVAGPRTSTPKKSKRKMPSDSRYKRVQMRDGKWKSILRDNSSSRSQEYSRSGRNNNSESENSRSYSERSRSSRNSSNDSRSSSNYKSRSDSNNNSQRSSDPSRRSLFGSLPDASSAEESSRQLSSSETVCVLVTPLKVITSQEMAAVGSTGQVMVLSQTLILSARAQGDTKAILERMIKAKPLLLNRTRQEDIDFANESSTLKVYLCRDGILLERTSHVDRGHDTYSFTTNDRHVYSYCAKGLFMGVEDKASKPRRLSIITSHRTIKNAEKICKAEDFTVAFVDTADDFNEGKPLSSNVPASITRTVDGIVAFEETVKATTDNNVHVQREVVITSGDPLWGAVHTTHTENRVYEQSVPLYSVLHTLRTQSTSTEPAARPRSSVQRAIENMLQVSQQSLQSEDEQNCSTAIPPGRSFANTDSYRSFDCESIPREYSDCDICLSSDEERSEANRPDTESIVRPAESEIINLSSDSSTPSGSGSEREVEPNPSQQSPVRSSRLVPALVGSPVPPRSPRELHSIIPATRSPLRTTELSPARLPPVAAPRTTIPVTTLNHSELSQLVVTEEMQTMIDTSFDSNNAETITKTLKLDALINDMQWDLKVHLDIKTDRGKPLRFKLRNIYIDEDLLWKAVEEKSAESLSARSPTTSWRNPALSPANSANMDPAVERRRPGFVNLPPSNEAPARRVRTPDASLRARTPTTDAPPASTIYSRRPSPLRVTPKDRPLSKTEEWP